MMKKLEDGSMCIARGWSSLRGEAARWGAAKVAVDGRRGGSQEAAEGGGGGHASLRGWLGRRNLCWACNQASKISKLTGERKRITSSPHSQLCSWQCKPWMGTTGVPPCLVLPGPGFFCRAFETSKEIREMLTVGQFDPYKKKLNLSLRNFLMYEIFFDHLNVLV